METKETKKRYPYQVYSVKRQSKVLGVDALLFTPTENDPSPLELHSGFSRFLFTIVDKTSSTTVTPRANIPCRDVDYIKLATDTAMQSYLLGTNDQGGGNDELVNRPAFTQKLTSNLFKNQTPAEVLIAHPEDKSKLLDTKKWLEANLAKYPINKRQIEAIDDALQLLEIGELTSAVPPIKNASAFPIYKTEYKHFSEKDKQGNSLIYSISITYDGSKNYPFTCEITNCFAPIEVMPGGTHRPVMKQATHMTKSSMTMSAAEWVGLITHIAKVKEYFEITNFRSLFGKAQEYDAQNRRESQNISKN